MNLELLTSCEKSKSKCETPCQGSNLEVPFSDHQRLEIRSQRSDHADGLVWESSL